MATSYKLNPLIIKFESPLHLHWEGGCNSDAICNRGLIQVGVGEAHSRKKNLKTSVSVHLARPRGPAGARHSPSRVQIVGVVFGKL
jgi:hypothetical protein